MEIPKKDCGTSINVGFFDIRLLRAWLMNNQYLCLTMRWVVSVWAIAWFLHGHASGSQNLLM